MQSLHEQRTLTYKKLQQLKQKKGKFEELQNMIHEFHNELELTERVYYDLEYQCAVIDGRLHIIPPRKQRHYVRKFMEDKLIEKFMKMTPGEQIEFIDNIMKERKK